MTDPTTTPDGRYIIVRGRLWRAANPNLPETERGRLVEELMAARRWVGMARRAHDPEAEYRAHAAVDDAKIALGERGPVWWDDGSPDLNRHLARNTHYAEWYAGVVSGATLKSGDPVDEGFETGTSDP